MPDQCTLGDAQEQAVLYALGMLEPELISTFERHLENCPVCLEEVRAFTGVAAQLAFAAAAEPPAHLRERVLSAVSPDSGPIFIRRAGQGVWLDTPFRGVSAKPLYKDPQTGLVTQLVRLRPGASYPSHRHSAPESCYVIEGDVQIGSDDFGTGDFTLAPAGTQHGMLSSRGGCLLLLTSNPHDEVTA